MADIINDRNLNPVVLKTMIENTEPAKTRRLAQFFPKKDVFDTNVAFNVINDTAIKAGSIIGFDAETPIKNKPQAAKSFATLTKISNAYFYTEEELLHYNRPRSEQESEEVITEAMRSIRNLAEGNEDTIELIRANFTYRGAFDYEDPKSKVKISFELDLPEGSYIEGADLADENVNPLEELQKAVESYQENNGYANPEYMVMNRKTFAKIKRNKNVVAQVYGAENAGKLIKNSDLQEVMNELDLPQLDLDDDYTVIEGINGDRKVQHMPDDRVVFHSSNLGRTLSGPSEENNYQPGVFVQNLKEMDPPNQKTIVGEVTIPILQNINGVAIYDFANASNDEPEDTTP